MFKKDPTRFPLLDPASLNEFGDSLFHVIAKIKFSKTSLGVTRILCEKGVKSNIKDSEGRLPVEYILNENDRRLQVSENKRARSHKFFYFMSSIITFGWHFLHF